MRNAVLHPLSRWGKWIGQQGQSPGSLCHGAGAATTQQACCSLRHRAAWLLAKAVRVEGWFCLPPPKLVPGVSVLLDALVTLLLVYYQFAGWFSLFFFYWYTVTMLSLEEIFTITDVLILPLLILEIHCTDIGASIHTCINVYATTVVLT